ncbi:MAG TPA: hypothetical protein VGR28_12320, partial [Candidatus Thermoplasmatota archaeon]|nr:hypothetical protein [Candidatus Thermoplasmatota archaeon]
MAKASAKHRRHRAAPRCGDEGSAAITGFAVAVAIYAIAFVVFITQIQGPIGQHREGPQLASRADGGLDTLLNSVGQLSSLSPEWQSKWTEDPDNITRLGLAP